MVKQHKSLVCIASSRFEDPELAGAENPTDLVGHDRRSQFARVQQREDEVARIGDKAWSGRPITQRLVPSHSAEIVDVEH